MTSYKPKPEHFSLNAQKLPTTHLYQSPNPSPSFFLNKQSPPNDHKLIINEINIKNQALKGHNIKQSNLNHPNYLTFCQQYTEILCHKYNPQQPPQLTHPNRNQENSKPKPFNQQLQQKISLNLIAYKRFFQAVQFDFDKDYEQLIMRLKYLTKMLYSRNSAFAQKDQQVDEELLIMQVFMNKINVKISQESTKIPNYFVTPFHVFVEDIKRGRTPESNNRRKEHDNSLNPYDRKDFIKGDNSEQKKKTISFIVSPNSPQMLLQSFNQQYNNKQQCNNDKQQFNNDMFVSFNQHTNNSHHHNSHNNYSRQTNQRVKSFKTKHQSKDLQNSQHIGDTLKYSESQMMGKNMFNIDLASRSIQLQQSLSIDQNDPNAQEVPFSPVQPYRLHKLYNQANLKKLNQQNTHKTDNLQEQQLFIDKQNNALYKQAITQIQFSLHASFDPLKVNAQKLTLALSQTLSDISQIITQSHVLLNEQKLSLNQQWNDTLRFISKDIDELQHGLAMDKHQNDIKDKKFLQNLQIIQNQLIQQIFQEKQSRKQQENLLTQVLTNLVDNLQNGFP